MSRSSDPDLLQRATDLGRVLFTRDADLLVEASNRQRIGNDFHGVIYAHLKRVDVGACIRDLEIIARAGQPEDLINHIEYLPL